MNTSGATFRAIADHYRAKIAAGDYQQGDKLPSVREMAAALGVSPGTASSALRQLESERLIKITHRGAYVDAPRAAHSPADRLRISRGGPAPGEVEHVREAGVVPFGEQYAYVAGCLGVDTTAGHVVRREKVVSHAGKTLGLVVTWYPVALTAAVPELAVPTPIEGGEAALIAERTGRRVASGEDFWEGRGARDDREAAAVGVDIGSPILAGAWIWRDRDGDVIEYGEVVSVSTRVIKYEYRLDT